MSRIQDGRTSNSVRKFRPILMWDDLKPKERKEFIDDDILPMSTLEESGYFRCRGMTISLSDVMRLDHPADNTDGPCGSMHLTNTSGILVWISNDGEGIYTQLV